MSDKHIIIIGGGIIGACCAFYLSKYSEYKITLIEKVEIACAASGKSGGFLARDWNDQHPGMKALTRASFQLYADLANEYEGEKLFGYRTLDTYSVIFDTSLEASHSEIDWLQNTIRSSEMIGSEATTAQVTPGLFTQTILSKAIDTNRVDVKVGCGVAQLLVYKNSIVGVQLESGEEIRGDKVVVAMGPWSGLLDLPQGDRIPIEGTHVHSIVLESDSTIPNQALFTAILDQGKTYEPEVYPRADGTVYICGEVDEEKLPKSADLVYVNKKSIQSLIYQASLVSPKLVNRPLLKEQACYLPVSEYTQLPLIGFHPNYKQLVLATGHSFWGILNGPITGKIISELLTTGQVSCINKEAMKYFEP